jgi:hypothetical protein
MEIKKIICDVCGREKREGEHWFVVKPGPRGLVFQRERDVDWPRDENALYENICDGRCPETRFLRWLDEQRVYVLLPAAKLFRLKTVGAIGPSSEVRGNHVHSGSDRRLASNAGTD